MKRDAFGNISPFDYYFSALNNLKYKNTSNISIPAIYHSECHENERGVSLFLRLKISVDFSYEGTFFIIGSDAV